MSQLASYAAQTARVLIRKLANGCGDNSCRFRKRTAGGMGTNGGCRCHEWIESVLEHFGRHRYEDEFIHGGPNCLSGHTHPSEVEAILCELGGPS